MGNPISTATNGNTSSYTTHTEIDSAVAPSIENESDSWNETAYTLMDNALSLIIPNATAAEPPTDEDKPVPSAPKRNDLQSASDWMEEFRDANAAPQPPSLPVLTEEPAEEFSTDSHETRMAQIDEQLLRQNPNGYHWKPTEHCAIITPAISPDKADEVKNPIIRAPLKISAGILTLAHTFFDFPLQAIALTDEYVNVGVVGGNTDLIQRVNSARSEIEDAKLQISDTVEREKKMPGTQYESELTTAKALLTDKDVENESLFTEFSQFKHDHQLRSWGARFVEAGLATVGGSYLYNYYKNTSLMDLAKAMEIELPKELKKSLDHRLAVLDDPKNFEIDRAQYLAGKKALVTEAKTAKLPLQIEALAAKLGIAPELVTADGFRTMPRGLRATVTKDGAAKFWSKYGLPLGLVLAVSGTGLVSEAKKGLGAIETLTGMEPLKGEQREWAKTGVYASMFIGAAALLNSNIKIPYTEMNLKGYRRIVSPSIPPAHARETSLLAGTAIALGLMAETWYFHNVSAQQRLLPALYGDDHGSAYWPGNWDQEYEQTHTAAARSIGWGLSGFVIAALSSWQSEWADKAGKKIGMISQELQKANRETLKSLGRKLDWFAATSEDIVLTSAEKRWIAEGGASRISQMLPTSMRSVYTKTFTGKRIPYTALQILTMFPLAIGVQQAVGYTQNFQSQEALTGTSMRNFLTVPTQSATTTYYTSSQGYATAWDGFKVSIPLFNYTWEQCSMQPEMVFQVAVKIADEYAYAENQDVKDEMEARLVTLYYISEEGTAERDRIKILLDAQSIDPEAVVAKAKTREANRLN